MAEPDFLTRTRTSYDALADEYATWVRELATSPWDDAVLGVFARHVAGRGRVLDAGCGEGRITAQLASFEVDAHGIDLSAEMIRNARDVHPNLRFEVGSLTDLRFDDESYVGVVAWYSLIHVPPEALPGAVAELVRVLEPGGWLLAAFQTDAETFRPNHLRDIAVSLEFHRPDPAAFGTLLDSHGLDVDATTVRAADVEAGERTRQAYVLARRRA
ncbi:class I SAM-dependent methyltransferase [Mumia sp. zg.B21]|uniref:class I SAM-dependent methyltransferase n=1 Tax=Mumia sp. zg.B21 TaxID=2855447 RepID=UPI001C6EECE5|nr:class I SAM-dependent methyltransferase [Mumia sp. zg.B21]MBW9210533.1 class I SAM-dependent methyltransferase [Mumia sp. zg.B21]